MKGASEYAKRLKRFLVPLKKEAPKRAPAGASAEGSDLVEELVLAILEEGTDRVTARRGLDSIMEYMVDYNDLRVTPPREIQRLLDRSFPRGGEKARRIPRVLNHIFEKKNSLNINSLRKAPIREVRSFLNMLEGMTPFVSAAVVRRCLGGHAIPVDEVVEKYLKDHDLAPPEASQEELQGFLERHVLASSSLVFTTVIRDRALAYWKRLQAREARAAAARKKPSRSVSRAARAAAAPKRKAGQASPSRSGRRSTTEAKKRKGTQYKSRKSKAKRG
jgi:endonuclease III